MSGGFLGSLNGVRPGTVDSVRVPVDLATVIDRGDFVWLDVDNAKPASAQVDQLTEETNQAELARTFLGISQDASRATDDDEIVVLVQGERLVTVVSDTYEIGDLLGASEDGAGTGLEDAILEKVTSPDLAIMKVTEREASATGTVRAELIRSAIKNPASGGADAQRNAVNVETLAADKIITLDEARFHALDPGGAGRNVDLPLESVSAGVQIVIANAADAAEVLTVRESGGGATVGTPDQDETASFWCDGTNWHGLVGPST